MMYTRAVGWSLVVWLAFCATASAAEPRHLVVARAEGRFLGWPANHGPMHAWGDEVLIAFTSAVHLDKGPQSHTYDNTQPQHVWLARSLDRGETWTIERPEALRGHKDPRAAVILPPTGGIDLRDPDCLVICGYEDDDDGGGWFQVSRDRGRTWSARQALPGFGMPGLCGRTDYVIDREGRAVFLFIATSAHKMKEGRVFAARTADGGRTWERLGLVGPDHADGFSIQPATVRIATGDFVTATRWQRPGRSGIELHRSADQGVTWATQGNVCDTGARSTALDLTRVTDGRLVLVYAQRDERKLCARISADEGQTWGDELTLRDDAGNWDLGYPRTIERPDGALLTAYYWNDDPTKERYIAGTMWRLPEAAGK